jgi:tRNA threonylcarbamoyl adenosine modification protein (Sua5/YciO/YrdC/YwlC family)
MLPFLGLTAQPSHNGSVSQYFKIHPVDPQQRLLNRAAEIIGTGGIVVYPTDATYALGWHIGDKAALERVRRLRGIERDHDFTLVCRDLSAIASYGRVDNAAYRLLKSLTPGPYTFILRATHEVPKRLQDPKRRSIGIRVPGNAIAQALLETLGEPIMSSTLSLPNDLVPLTDPEEIRDRLEGRVEAVIDGGNCGIEPTSVLDLSDGGVVVVRKGKGDISSFSA